MTGVHLQGHLRRPHLLGILQTAALIQDMIQLFHIWAGHRQEVGMVRLAHRRLQVLFALAVVVLLVVGLGAALVEAG